MTKARVYTLEHRHALLVLLNQARIINMPGDAEIVAYQTRLNRGGLDLRVHSNAFPSIREGDPIPVIAAQIEITRK